jgi:quercetin dioxygenase-like cupin family protein
MAELISTPTRIMASGTPAKIIEEFVGRSNTKDVHLSIARMKSPPGWSEPGQTPEFEEFTVVLQGTLHVKLRKQAFAVHAGQAIRVRPQEWVQYSTPDGAEYIAVCFPAFSADTVHRDE